MTSLLRLPIGLLLGAWLMSLGIMLVVAMLAAVPKLARNAPVMLVSGVAVGAVAVLVGAWIARRYAPRRSATEQDVSDFRREQRRR